MLKSCCRRVHDQCVKSPWLCTKIKVNTFISCTHSHLLLRINIDPMKIHDDTYDVDQYNYHLSVLELIVACPSTSSGQDVRYPISVVLLNRIIRLWTNFGVHFGYFNHMEYLMIILLQPIRTLSRLQGKDHNLHIITLKIAILCVLKSSKVFQTICHMIRFVYLNLQPSPMLKYAHDIQFSYNA